MSHGQFNLRALFWATFFSSILAWLAIHPMIAFWVIVCALALPGAALWTLGIVDQILLAAKRLRRG